MFIQGVFYDQHAACMQAAGVDVGQSGVNVGLSGIFIYLFIERS